MIEKKDDIRERLAMCALDCIITDAAEGWDHLREVQRARFWISSIS